MTRFRDDVIVYLEQNLVFLITFSPLCVRLVVRYIKYIKVNIITLPALSHMYIHVCSVPKPLSYHTLKYLAIVLHFVCTCTCTHYSF